MAGKVLAVLLPLLLCLSGLAGLLLLCIPTRDVREPPAYKYGIVLDAGSSHTSMFVYKWPADKENDTGIVSQHSMCDVHGGGISSYAEDPPGAGRSLVSCLNQAMKDVPKERHSVTPLYLGATAGMRLLNLTSPAASDSVLSSVTETLTQYPFDFRGARILSGQDEGVFGWVTANYLLENFIKYGWVGEWIRPRQGTVGAMDLGGASTQITFETASQAEDPANEVKLQLYGQSYRVYTHSFLCYGRDQILKRLLAGVLQKWSSHPCWPIGYSRQVLLKDVYMSPCTSAQRPQDYDVNTEVTLSGSGDPILCQQLVSDLFNFSSCPFSQCSFNGIFQPPVVGNFIAFSAFYYTVDFLRKVMKLPVTSPGELRIAAKALCNESWVKLLERAPGQQARLADYCACATFVNQLLLQGYKFDEHTFPSIAFQKKAGDTSIGWALGYMLNLTNMIPPDQRNFRKGTDYGSWVVLILLFIVVILVALAMLFCFARSSKSQSAI
ncbi:ectonucleoside triphosphate diphosphohydrolase 2 isoform X2 [Phascolarctos cinereus]|uniref:Ectonucleoside triphosphate diphosphohydrolase 2 isoform X2 n=1 Tax=Phascolarctos cinereus TaxID=38626 RepID=A0A6P5JXQ3_PHACI|nr:ectonucleoside triphosphate diphosphohydrolase 2 isoform X2 [Phascolarctos cinereus]